MAKKHILKAAKRKVRSTSRKTWTFIVYMAGDNNLSEDMISSIEAIKHGLNTAFPNAAAVAGKNKVAYVIWYDGSHPMVATQQYQLDFSFGKPFPPSTPIGEDIEKLAIEKKIKQLIKTAVQLEPADNYALVISGHNDGLLGRTFLLDDDPQSVASIITLKKKIKEAICELKAPGSKEHFPKNRLDLLCFDACVANSLEIMYEFKDCAVAFIGSQGSIPNYTWNYAGIANELATLTPRQLTQYKVSKTILDEIKRFNQPFAFQGRSIDVSAIKLQNIDDMAVPFSRFIIALYSMAFETSRPAWLTKYWLRSFVCAHTQAQTFGCEQSVDLRDYSDCVKSAASDTIGEINTLDPNSTVPAVVAFLADLNRMIVAINNLQTAIDNLRICPPAIVGGDYRFANGISIFFPQGLLPLSMAVYRYVELDFVKKPTLGYAWLICMIIHLLVTARPDIQFHAPLPSPSSLPPLTQQTLGQLNKRKSASAISTQLNAIISALLGSGQGFRDNPPRSKGFDEYIEYFRTMKNFFPTLKP